jgi:hypothetical protein
MKTLVYEGPLKSLWTSPHDLAVIVQRLNRQRAEPVIEVYLVRDFDRDKAVAVVGPRETTGIPKL